MGEESMNGDHSGRIYAGFWERLLANAIDWALLLFTMLSLVAVIAIGGVSQWEVALLIALAALPPLYFITLESGSRGASLGKRLLCLRVVRQNSLPTGYWRGLLRYVAFAIIAPMTIGYLVQPFTQRRQALHDLASSTVVVKTEGRAALNLLKAILSGIAVLIAIPLALYVALLAYNWCDEPLRADVQALLNWQVPSEAYGDNGFLILLGHDAPPDVDARMRGIQVLKAWEQQFRERSSIGTWSDTPPKPNTPQAAMERRCTQETKNCVTHYLKSREPLARLLAESTLQLSRYTSLRAAHTFHEVALPMHDTPATNWSWLVQASEKVRIQALYDIADGNPAKGIALFEDNARFARQLLKSSVSLDAHITALGMVRRDARWIAEITVAYPQLNKHSEAVFAAALQPLDASLKSFRMVTETAERKDFMMLRAYKKLARTHMKGLLITRFFQLNATQNLSKALSDLRSEKLGRPAHLLDDAGAGNYDQALALYGWGLFNMFYTQNPVGKILLVQLPFEPAMKWVEYQHDVTGYLSLVRLQQKVLQQRIPKTQLGEYLATTPSESRNPYTLQPMVWSETRGALEFTGHQGAHDISSRNKTYSVSLKNTP